MIPRRIVFHISGCDGWLMTAIACYLTGWSKNVSGLVKSAYGTLVNRLHASSSAREKLSSNRNDGTSCSRIFWLRPQSQLP